MKAAEKCLWPRWTKSAQLAPLWEYLRADLRERRRFEVGGIDAKLTTPQTRENILSALEEDSPPEYASAFKAARPTIEALMTNPKNFALDEPSEQALVELVEATPAGPVRLLTASVLAHARTMSTLARLLAEHGAGLESRASAAELNNMRDEQMAKNLLYMVNERFPNQRVVIWAANTHISRNAGIERLDKNATQFDGYLPMGEHVKRALGEEVLTIGFSAAGGSYGYPGRKPKVVETSPDSLEARAAEVGSLTYVDLAGSDDFDEPLVGYAFGYAPVRATWPSVFDALMIHREMKPSTAR